MRVAVLGGGYAGLVLARSLESSLPEADLVVVDETGTHLIQHELHRVVRRPSLAEEVVVPLDRVLDAEVRTTRVEAVDREARRVHLSHGTLAYDAVAVCLGAQTAYHGIPGVAEHATPLKRLDHARRIRAEFPDRGTVLVGGAGLSGVQVAGELAALARERDADVEVCLIEREQSVAPSFPEAFRTAVERELRTRGVSVRTGERVERATGDRVVTDGGEIGYDQFVWTGGIRGPGALGGERERVRSTLALDDRTYVVGDAARVIDAEGEAVPASAQAAVKGARVAAANIRRVLRGEGGSPERFRFDSGGWLVSVGDGAVAQIGPAVFTGPAAKALKSSVGAGYLASAGAVRDAVALVRAEFRRSDRATDA